VYNIIIKLCGFSFKSLDIFYDQIGKTRAAMGRAEMMPHRFIIILYTRPLPPRAIAPVAWQRSRPQGPRLHAAAVPRALRLQGQPRAPPATAAHRQRPSGLPLRGEVRQHRGQALPLMQGVQGG
jgi:hypothetical protein